MIIFVFSLFLLICSNSSRNDIQRLAGIRSIESVIRSDREETFRRVLPKFKVKIDQVHLFDKNRFILVNYRTNG